MSLIKDFIIYNKGNECPQAYILWAAYAVISTVAGPRFNLDMQHFNLFPDLMICLVGESGNRKSFALTKAAQLLRSVVPDIILCADQETPQGITKFMMRDEQIRICVDYAGNRTSYRPYGCFASELGNWIALNPQAMASFLTDIHDKYIPGYAYRIKDEYFIVPHPYFTMLACTVPELITDKIKGAEFCSGFGRRVIFVCSTEEIMCEPKLSQESKDAYERCKARLQRIIELHGVFTMEPSAKTWFWDKWYPTRKRPVDKLLKAQFRTEHIIVLKLAMLTALAERDELVITFYDLQRAMAIWYENKKHMPLLTNHLGRSELVEADEFLFDQLRRNGGKMREDHLYRLTFHYFRGTEQEDYFKYLQRSHKIELKIIDNKVWYLLPNKDENEPGNPIETVPEMPEQYQPDTGSGTQPTAPAGGSDSVC